MSNSLSVGPFTVSATVCDQGVAISAGLDWHGISFHESATLSFEHPSVTLSTPTVLHCSASVTVSMDAATGVLTASAKACTPHYEFPDHIHVSCDTESASLNLLPPHGLCFLANGLTSAGISWLLDQSGAASVTCASLTAFRGIMTPDRATAVEALRAVTYEGTNVFHAISSAVGAADDDVRGALSDLTTEQWTSILHAVVTAPQLDAVLPGVAQRFDFGDGSPAAGPPLTDIDWKKVAEIVEGLVAAAILAVGAAGTTVAAVSGIALALLVPAATLGVGFAVAAAIVGVVAIVLLCIALELTVELLLVAGLVAGVIILLSDEVRALARSEGRRRLAVA